MGIGDGAEGVVVGEPVWPPADGEAAIGIFEDAHLGAREVGTQRRWRDLQAEPLPLHGVVVADDALFLDAEDIAPRLGGIGDEGGAVLLCSDREAGIVFGHIAAR